MSAQPVWAAVDDDTADLLSLVANDEMTPRPAEEWDEFVRCLNHAADPAGYVSPNRLREMVRGSIAPRRIGAFTRRALLEGLIEWSGEWETSEDTQGRNAGRPMRAYRLDIP